MRNPVPIEVVQLLKTVPSGERARVALRKRMACQLKYHGSDPMVARIVPLIAEYKPTGKILDVGCYTGWLYHYLGKPEGYVGIDIWKEAIEVAKEFAPEADFQHRDLMDMNGDFDTVWCVQIPWHRTGIRVEDAVAKMKTLGKRLVVAVVREDIFGSNFRDHGQLLVWDSNAEVV